MSLETKAAPANHATTEAGHCAGSEIHVAGHDHDHDERDDCGHVVEQDHYRAERDNRDHNAGDGDHDYALHHGSEKESTRALT